jgi:hypothetical protein
MMEVLMIVKIAMVSCEHASEAKELSAKLKGAVEVGNMQIVDESARKLSALTDKKYSVLLSEESWRQLLTSVRESDKDFEANYLIDRSQLETIASAKLTAEYDDVIEIVQKALKIESIVLQLPCEEEEC